MSCKIIFFLLLVGLIAVKTTNAQDLAALNAQISETLEYVAEHDPDSLSAITEQVSSLSQQIMNAQGDPSKVTELTAQLKSTLANASNPSCGILKNGKQYYLRISAQYYESYVVVQPNQLAFMSVNSTSPSKFTIMQKDCNLYGLYVNGYSMSRCEDCPTPLGERESVRFHLTDSNSPWSQWVLSPVSGRVGAYHLKADNFGYLTYKSASDGSDVITLDTQLTENSEFEFIEVVDNCGIILEDGKQYTIQMPDGKAAVLDMNKQLVFMKVTSIADLTIFTAVRKSCNVYGFCAGSSCMSRCANCPSDSGDTQTVRFHLSNSDLPWSQWTLTSPPGQYGGPYSLTAEPQFGNLVSKRTDPGRNQLTLEVTNEITNAHRFEFVKFN